MKNTKRVLAFLVGAAMMLPMASAEGKLASGNYEATGQGFGGAVTVKVTVTDGKVTAAAITGDKETETIGGAAIKTLTEKLIGVSSADEVDAVASATVTSNAVKTALADCLRQAAGEEKTETALVDGVYTGEGRGFNLTQKVQVTVEIKDGKMKKSVVICMNSLISVIIFCMIIMLLCSCVSAARTTWKQAKKTYHSMVEYYTRDVENNLSNISDYLLRISETADYYGMTNCEEDKESMNNLSRQRLYNQLNEDILVYSSADYFFIFQDKYADIMMVESAKKKAKIQSQNIREQLKRLLESREPTEKWELFDAEGYQYLIRVVSKDGVGIGCAVSLNRLIETMQAVQLSDYYVSYYKIGTMILDNESGKDLKIELPIQETDVGVRIVIPSEKLFEEIRTLLNFSMVFAVILIILLFALYISMYHWFTNPVKRIVSVMQKVDEEGIDLKMPEFDNWEEYHIVSKNFNNMMEKIKILKIDVYEKEKKQSELYKQYLMLQINPHFFLNALNTIYMLNKRKDNNQVNILLTYLINYFKSVFARQGEMVPLKEEINFMLNYMAIQKFRFAGAMHLQCEIEPEAEISMVPAMCVLTFVENAIKYSTDFSNDLMIVVSAKVEGDNIKIEIQDNGEGIEENILKKINQNEKIVKNDREHIGIKNIVDRMHMHYGEAASVKVTNRDSGGVSVVINVPK